MSEFVIVGAGAIGAIVGVALIETGHDVRFIDSNQDHVAAVRRHGLRLSGHRSAKVETPIQYLASGPTFVTHRIGCTKRAERDLGFQWSVDLEDGMRSLIDWRRRQALPLAA